MAAIEQRGDRQWRARVRRRGWPTETRTFRTKADALAWAREVEVEIDRGVFVSRTDAERTTLDEALKRYEAEITPLKKGAKQERSRIALWRRDELALRPLASIRGADIAEWRDERLADGASPTTVRNDLMLISHLFNVAITEWGLESLRNPIRTIRVPSAARARDRRLRDGEEARLMKACARSRARWLGPLVRFALATGMRLGELLALRWKDVDLKRRTATLEDTKNGERRIVPLSPAAMGVLERLDRLDGARVFTISLPAVEQAFRRACEWAELEDFRFHDLRHEATSRFFEGGLNPMEVSAITGHKTLQMLKRYTHLRAEELAEKLHGIAAFRTPGS